MQIRRARQLVFADLHDGADQYQVPLRMRRCHIAQQIAVQPLIQYSEKSDAWMRNGSLIFRVLLRVASASKMLAIDAARKKVNVAMLRSFGGKKAGTSGKNNVGPGEQLLL